MQCVCVRVCACVCPYRSELSGRVSLCHGGAVRARFSATVVRQQHGCMRLHIGRVVDSEPLLQRDGFNERARGAHTHTHTHSHTHTHTHNRKQVRNFCLRINGDILCGGTWFWSPGCGINQCNPPSRSHFQVNSTIHAEVLEYYYRYQLHKVHKIFFFSGLLF